MIESSQDAKPAKRFGISELLLVASNILPLVGVFYFGWSVFEIVLVYWIENLIVGFLNIIRMALASKGGFQPTDLFGKLFMIGFFIVHYGLFCTVHGVFVFALLGNGAGSPFDFIEKPVEFAIREFATIGNVAWAAGALLISHTVSLLVNFIGRGEYRERDTNEQMAAPYPRMVALHVAIVLGAFAVQALGQPIFLLVILVVGKTIVDLKLHLKSHRKSATSPQLIH